MAEIDPAFEEYRRRWATRLKMSDRTAAESFMRGAALDLAGEDEVERRPGQVGFYLRVEGRGLNASADVGALSNMLDDWKGFLDAEPTPDRRAFTKQYIVQVVAQNYHVHEELGPLILSGMLWLVSDDKSSMDALRAGDVVLSCEMTFEQGRLRTKMDLLYEGDEA